MAGKWPLLCPGFPQNQHHPGNHIRHHGTLQLELLFSMLFMLKAKVSFSICGNLDYSEIFSVFPPISRQVQMCPHLTNVQLGHMTHFGQSLLLADLLLKDLALLEISNMLPWLGMFFWGFHHPEKSMIHQEMRDAWAPTACSQDPE